MADAEIRDTKYEIRVKRPSPAMRRWVEKIRAGYTVRPVMTRSTYRGTVWGAALYNPSGGFVQMIRRDTACKLMEMGLIGPKESGDDHERADAPDGGD